VNQEGIRVIILGFGGNTEVVKGSPIKTKNDDLLILIQ